MRIDPIRQDAGRQERVRQGSWTQKAGFSTVLNNQMKQHDARAESLRKDMPTSPEHPQQAVCIGEISETHPTVSHLLINHPDYRQNCWQIIHSEQNRNKPYRKIETGTRIYIDSDTHRLFWDSPESAASYQAGRGNQSAVESSENIALPEQGDFTDRFVRAIRQNLGRGYEDVNCYELIVQGLRQLGYRYGGPGGLKEELIDMAISNNEPVNTYFSGEGLVASAGTADFVQSYDVFSDFQEDAGRIMDEIASVIQPGQILSFSTPSRGHTGIISTASGQWTFVNSGVLDHDIGESSPNKGVGEETLISEIYNWIKLATRKNEPLVVTLGHLDEDKLEKYRAIPWGA